MLLSFVARCLEAIFSLIALHASVPKLLAKVSCEYFHQSDKRMLIIHFVQLQTFVTISLLKYPPIDPEAISGTIETFSQPFDFSKVNTVLQWLAP